MSDIEIARAASKIHIRDVAAKINIPEESLVPYGHDKKNNCCNQLISLRWIC